MAMKVEGRPSAKETYRLWWEYLKRSEIYKAYCDAAQKVGNEADPKAESFLADAFDESDPEFLVCLDYMERNWEHFGDVFRDSFDDWWKKKKASPKQPPVVVLNDPKACEALPRFAETLSERRKAKQKFPSPEEMLQRLTESEPNFIFLAVPMVGGVTMEDISKKIADIRKKWADKFDIEDFNSRRFRMPVSRVRLEEMRRYLKVYDLKEQGLKMKEIIAEINPGRRGDNADVLRSFRSDLQKAKKIIMNVECGSFPEEPQF